MISNNCKIRQSQLIIIPDALLEQLNLRLGDEVELCIENGRLIVESADELEYSLNELLKQCDGKPITLDDDGIAWLNS